MFSTVSGNPQGVPPTLPTDGSPLAARLARWARVAAGVLSVLSIAFIPLARQDVPWAEEIVRSTAQQVRFVAPGAKAGSPAAEPETPGGVWFLTVSERRLSILEQALGAGKPQVVRSEAVGRFDADGDFLRSRRVARELALRLDPDPRILIGDDVLGAPDLHEGDRVVLVGGEVVETLEEAEARIRRWRLGRTCKGCDKPLRLTVLRGEHTVNVELPAWRRHRVQVPLTSMPSVPLPAVGDARGGSYEGGSAGLAFTLAYLDRLSGGDLLAGRSVAATGTIDPHGAVGPVGRVPYKLEAAIAAGAQVIFVPALNAHEVPAGLPVPVVAVEHLADAIGWLCGGRTEGACATLRR